MRRVPAVGGVMAVACALSALAINAAVASPDAPAPAPRASATPDVGPPPDPAAHKGPIRGGAGDAYTLQRVVKDRSGALHARYVRTYHGLKVLGGDFVLHAAADGSFAGASTAQPAALTVATTPQVQAARAQSVARGAFTGTVDAVGTPELVVDAASGGGRLAWQTVVKGMQLDGQTPSVLHVFSDARTGAVIRSYDEVESVTGKGSGVYTGSVGVDTTFSGGTYQLRDPSHGNGYTCDLNNRTSGSCTIFTDADNVWGTGSAGSRQSAAVDAHFGAAKTFDYFASTFHRNGIFGDGAGVPSRVHYGQNYANAFWDGSRMTYGDGAGNARPVVSLDVAGHEMSHGVTQALANLAYSGEPGGLNEATSDIFGTMVEFSADAPSDPGDYLLGERLNLTGNGAPLRYLYDPARDGRSDSCWSTGTAGKNVHYSSGVANHFFFLLAEGSGSTSYGTSPVCNGAAKVTGTGRAAAAAIWYHALDAYFTSSTRYVDSSSGNNDARNYTLKAAADLYGSCSTQYRAVQAAWTAVNVAGEDAVCRSSSAKAPATGSAGTGSAGTGSAGTGSAGTAGP